MAQLWGLRRWLSTSAASRNVGLLIALAIVGVTACGYSGSYQGSTPSTQPSAQVIHPSVQAAKCGTVQGFGNLKVPVADTGAEQAKNCFWHAFQQCQPTSLVYIIGGVDTVLIRTFMIHNENGMCLISDAKQWHISSNLLSAPEIFACADLLQKPDGLYFSGCGKDGDIFVRS
jgi:hypothetical protein